MAQTVDRARVTRLRAALSERNIESEYYETGAEALARLKELVPLGSEVQTGSSTTLDQIGFTSWLKGLHETGKLRYFRAETQQHADPAVRTANRRRATLAEYFLGSVNALTEDGVAVVCDASGTRLGGYIFGAQRVIWVVGVNKIVPTLEDAMRRIREVALPGEDARVKALGEAGSAINKVGIFYGESAIGRIRMLLIGEPLGF
ncbi:MAG TPA: lactate utilization protein [Chloroflexota bacterium]|nr:lactate utilization protein [Chloroflexota bacterium]